MSEKKLKFQMKKILSKNEEGFAQDIFIHMYKLKKFFFVSSE